MNKKEKYKNTNTKESIYGDNNFFQFGVCCFRIYDKCCSKNNNYINDDKIYYDIPKDFGLTDGESNFTISSYEVYQVEFWLDKLFKNTKGFYINYYFYFKY